MPGDICGSALKGFIDGLPSDLAWTDELRERYGRPPYNTENDARYNVILDDYVESSNDQGHRIIAEKLLLLPLELTAAGARAR